MSEAHAKQPSLAERIDALYAFRQSIKEEQAKVDDLKSQANLMEADILAALEELGLEGAKGSAASATVTTMVHPQVNDWDAFTSYVRDHNAFHLLQRRVTSAAYREMVDAGESLPGVEPFTKTALGLRRVNVAK